ncbi:MAG: histidinol-phosphate transaminase [Lentisphaeria bacterium]|nr:histidinol-phosphate transaminase [Lentisphaeria bacterium]
MSYARANISRMSGYVPGEQPKDKQYTKLNTNENPYPPSPKVFEALANLNPECLRLYSEPVSRDLRGIASEWIGRSPEWALCGNGSDDLLTIAFRTFVDQDQPVAYTMPSYSLYPVLADLQGAQHRVVELDDHFRLPLDAAARARGASLFIVSRPNAPTGNAFPLDAMHQLCKDFEGVLWIDEAYADFADDNCLEFVTQYPNVVVSRTLSKSYSLAGIRLGVAFANPDLISEMMKVKDSYNVNTMTQLVGAAALRDRGYMRHIAERIRATRSKVTGELTALGFHVLPSQANFLLAEPPCDAEALFLALRDRGFLVRYFKQERIRQFIRVTIGTEEQMTAFAETVSSILAAGL